MMESWTSAEICNVLEDAVLRIAAPPKPKATKQLSLTKVPKPELLAQAALLKVGFEFTFTHRKKSERERRSTVVDEKDFDALVIARKYFDKPIRELVRCFKTDDGCIECSYPPTLDIDTQLNLFNDLKAMLHPWAPYISELHPDGGMHINIDGNTSNLKKIVKAIPAIAWVFAPGSDNENSMINGWNKSSAVNERTVYTEFRCVATFNDAEHVRLAAEFFRRFAAYAMLCRVFQYKSDVKYSLANNPFDKELAKFNRLLERLYLNPNDYTWFVDSHMRIRYMHEAKNPGKFLT